MNSGETNKFSKHFVFHVVSKREDYYFFLIDFLKVFILLFAIQLEGEIFYCRPTFPKHVFSFFPIWKPLFKTVEKPEGIKNPLPWVLENRQLFGVFLFSHDTS